MNNVLLINSPNRLSEPPRHYPYGLGIITSVLENEGYKVDTLDGNFVSKEAISEQVKKNNYDLIGISGLVTTFNYQAEIAKNIRSVNKKAIIASGGGLASAVDKELLELIPELNLIFIGEGEETIKEFMPASSAQWKDIKGIAYREGENIIRNSERLFNGNLDSVPLPNLDKWFIEEYFENKSFPLSKETNLAERRGNILTSRGCPYKCDFCFNKLGRNKVRKRSSDNVLGEIGELVDKYNIDFLSFMDEEFLVNRKLVEEVSYGILKNNWDLKWGIAARSTTVNKENLSIIKEAGCDFIYFGFDSGSPETLLQMKKRMTVEDNFNAFRLSVEAGIFPVPNIIIGYDNESLKNIEENYDFFKELINYGKTLKDSGQKEIFETGFNNFGAIYFATPYPGSELYNRNKERLPPLKEILERVSFNDAYELTVNTSQIPDKILVQEQKKMVDYVRGFKL